MVGAEDPKGFERGIFVPLERIFVDKTCSRKMFEKTFFGHPYSSKSTKTRLDMALLNLPMRNRHMERVLQFCKWFRNFICVS